MSLRRRRPPQWLTLESNKAAAETISITITRIAGSPAAAWRVVDGGQIYEYSGDALSHVVRVGPCEIECRIAPKWIASLNCNSQSILAIKNFKKCQNATTIAAYLNAYLNIDLSDFPDTIYDIHLGWCPAVRGSIDYLPVAAKYVTLKDCSNVVGSSLPNTIIAINLDGCSTHVDAFHPPGAVFVDFSNNHLPVSGINSIILDIWQHRADFTYAGGITCNLDGNNAAPSGNVIEPEEGSDWHLDGETWIPLTVGAMVFDLVNDVNSEGFNFWNITVT